MLTYYELTKFRDQFYFILFLLIVCIGVTIFKDFAIDTLFLFIMPLYILYLTSPKINRIINDTAIFFLVFSIIVAILISWIFEIQLSVIGIIDDDKMLVFGTFFFAFLTYMAMRNNTKIFQYQRMPYLKIDLDRSLGDEFTFTCTNKSEFPAEGISINFEIVYPIPENPIKSIKLFIQRQLELTISFIYLRRPDFCKFVSEERLEPKESIKIDIIDKIITFLPIITTVHQEHFKRYYSEEEICFNIIIDFTYASTDNLQIKDPIYKMFKFKSDRAGIKLIRKSGRSVKII